MLELIWEKCLDSPEKCAQFRIQNIHFAGKLLEAFDSRSDIYQDKSSFGWLHHLGENLVQEWSTHCRTWLIWLKNRWRIYFDWPIRIKIQNVFQNILWSYKPSPAVTVITVVHLGSLNNTLYWVPLVIQKTKVCFGDSFRTGMPEMLQPAYGGFVSIITLVLPKSSIHQSILSQSLCRLTTIPVAY